MVMIVNKVYYDIIKQLQLFRKLKSYFIRLFIFNNCYLLLIEYNMDGYLDRLKDIRDENIVWVIYLGIILLSYYANYKEVRYILTKSIKEKEEYREIMLIIFIILVCIYYYFTKSSYVSVNKLNIWDSDKKKTLTYAAFIASLLVLISGIIFLLIIILDDNIDVEIAFN